jgi:hypothetical protein
MTPEAEAHVTARRILALGAARVVVLAVSLVVGTALAFGGAQAHSQKAPLRAHAISVDVTPLLEKGLSTYALIVRDDLWQAFETEFAGQLQPGQRLLVFIRGISLASYVGGRDLLWPQSDFMDGEVTLLDAGGRLLATQKLLVQSPASSGGAWYIRGGELRRTAALSQVFAAWARRYLSS